MKNGLFFLLIINVINLYAEESVNVEVVTHPESPVVNSTWTLSLIVDYPYPDDVFVIEPPFTEKFFLERVLKYPKMLDTGLKTVFEYSFIPSESGSFKIGTFTVTHPDGAARTEQFNLDVRPLNEIRTLPVQRLFWEINDRQASSLSREDSFQITAGESAFACSAYRQP